MNQTQLLNQILKEQKKTNELLQVIVSNKEQLATDTRITASMLATVIHDPSKLNFAQGNILGNEPGRVILTV